MSFNSRAKKQKLIRPDAGAELASLPATTLSARWDKASKLQRCDILASFVERFHACTAAEIERHFGSGAHLFFSRLTAALRLSYKTMAATCDRFGILLLMAIGLFLQGQRFLTSFAEIGGIQLLCDFVASIPNCSVASSSSSSVVGGVGVGGGSLNNENNSGAIMMSSPSRAAGAGGGASSSSAFMHQSNNNHNNNNNVASSTIVDPRSFNSLTVEAAAKTRAIRLLIHIANSGRVYREMLCEDGGLQHLANATCFEADDGVLELIGSLFLSLGHGNPRRVRDVHAALLHMARTGNDSAALCAASTLRALQVARIGPAGFGGGGGGGVSSPGTANENQQQTNQPSVGMLLPSSSSSNRNQNYSSNNNGDNEQQQEHNLLPDIAAGRSSAGIGRTGVSSKRGQSATVAGGGAVMMEQVDFSLPSLGSARSAGAGADGGVPSTVGAVGDVTATGSASVVSGGGGGGAGENTTTNESNNQFHVLPGHLTGQGVSALQLMAGTGADFHHHQNDSAVGAPALGGSSGLRRNSSPSHVSSSSTTAPPGVGAEAAPSTLSATAGTSIQFGGGRDSAYSSSTAGAAGGGGGGGGFGGGGQQQDQEAGLALYMDSLFHLLRSPSIRVRFEGIELLSLSAPGQGILMPMLRRCVEILDDVDTTLHAISALPYERERAFIFLHASCVRLVFALITHKDERVSLETLRVFEMRLLHLCLGRFMRVTQESHGRSMLSQSLREAASKSLLQGTAAPTAAPGVQDAVRIFKALLTAEGLGEAALAVPHVERVRRTVEAWLRKTLGDELFAPLLDPNSSLHDPYVIAITEKLSEMNRKQLEEEDLIDAAVEERQQQQQQRQQQQREQREEAGERERVQDVGQNEQNNQNEQNEENDNNEDDEREPGPAQQDEEVAVG